MSEAARVCMCYVYACAHVHVCVLHVSDARFMCRVGVGRGVLRGLVVCKSPLQLPGRRCGRVAGRALSVPGGVLVGTQWRRRG